LRLSDAVVAAAARQQLPGVRWLLAACRIQEQMEGVPAERRTGGLSKLYAAAVMDDTVSEMAVGQRLIKLRCSYCTAG
jgi:hypothetical protein